jgi:hypothetical protein
MANPITWQVDILRFATIGSGNPATLVAEGVGFVVFTLAAFAAAHWSLRRQE